MQMIRSFLPVGQGAFYCETFDLGKERINVIYDCGSSTSIKLMEKQIKQTFDLGEEIHALFISHFHSDHINGIQYLLKHCKVKKIFFPLLTKKEKEYMLLCDLIVNEKETVVSEFLKNPRGFVDGYGEDITLYGVREHEEDSDEDRTFEGIENVASGLDVGNIIMEGVKGYEWLKENWKYVPFNFKQAGSISKLEDGLKKQFGKLMSNDELKEAWEKDVKAKKKIFDAYMEVGDFNTNSMTLFSGICYYRRQQVLMPIHCRCCYYRPCFLDSKLNGCLYTGDYDASATENWNELHNAYKKYWEYIGCIQVPHHGSIDNFNSKLADCDAYYIISAGKSNRYGHPHASVLKTLLLKGHEPLIVTEECNSAVYIDIGV